MALNANKAAGSARPRAAALEPGNYPARLVQVLDLGIQAQRPYKGEEKDPIQEIMLTYELTEEFLLNDEGEPDETKPRWLSERVPLYNLKADKAKSTKRYLALDPKQDHGGDWTELLGAACLVNIVNNERNGTTYNNVGAISAPIKGMAVREPVNEPRFFDMDDPDMETFENLPDWVQGVIKESLSFPGSRLDGLLNGEQTEQPEAGQAADVDDDLPV